MSFHQQELIMMTLRSSRAALLKLVPQMFMNYNAPAIRHAEVWWHQVAGPKPTALLE